MSMFIKGVNQIANGVYKRRPVTKTEIEIGMEHTAKKLNELNTKRKLEAMDERIRKAMKPIVISQVNRQLEGAVTELFKTMQNPPKNV